MKKFGFLGIILVLVSWVVPQTDRVPYIYRILTPKYNAATTALSDMYSIGNTLEAGDEGFTEISSILNDELTIDWDQPIRKIKTISESSVKKMVEGGSEVYDIIKVEISYPINDPIIYDLENPGGKITDRYLQDSIFLWSSALLFPGIGIILVALFLADKQGYVERVVVKRHKACKCAV